MSATLAAPIRTKQVPVIEIMDRNPEHVWIEPTNRCNTRCTHCEHYYRHFGEDMPFDLFQIIRDHILDGVTSAELIGYGEPFMAKNYWEIFDELVRRNIRIASTSNGILLRDDARVSKLMNHHMTLSLSIDGARKETLEFVRPYIKWHKMLETLECLKRNADAAGPDRKFKLWFNFVAMKQNIGDLPELVRIAAKYGCSQINILPLGFEELFEKVNGQSLQDSPELVSPAFMEALPLAMDLGVNLVVPPAFKDMIFEGAEGGRGIRGRVAYAGRYVKLGVEYVKRRGVSRAFKKLESESAAPPADRPKAKVGGSWCMMPWKDSYIGSGGTVYPCCIMSEELGNLKEQSWPEVWNGPGYRNLRRTTHSWNPSSVCRTCPLVIGINGGDGKIYDKFFSKYRGTRVALDDECLEFSGDFHELEFANGKPDHMWMGRNGRITIKLPVAAKFIRLHLIPRGPVKQPNLGTCVINDGEPEPFDNSCDVVHFPVVDPTARVLEIDLSMEFGHFIGEDTRELSLGLNGIEVLS